MSEKARPAGTQTEKPLDSWKEICSYLKRDIRTLRRWEKDEGLPIRRHMHTSRASVYAFRSELDAWVASRQPSVEPQAPPAARWRPAAAAVAALLVMVVSTGGRPVPTALNAAQLGQDVTLSRAWSGEGVNPEGQPTPDGKFLTFADWTTGDLAVRDLEAGTNRHITDKGSWEPSANYTGEEYAQDSTVSPTGDRVAYSWWNGQFYELRTIGLDGSDMRVVYANAEVVYIQPTDWSPDGRHILAKFLKPDRTYQIVLVNSTEGSVSVLKTLDWRQPGTPTFSPDGGSVAYDLPPNPDTEDRDVYLMAADGSREVPLVDHPADDWLLGWAPDGSHVVFVSTRTGSADAWAVAVTTDGPVGRPTIVKSNLGRALPMGLAGDGLLFYDTSTQGEDLYTAAFDLNTMTIADSPTRFPLPFEGTNSAGNWSPDGRFLAYYRRLPPRAGRQLIVRSLTDDTEQEFAMTIRPSAAPPHWSPDGSTLIFRAYDERNQQGVFAVTIESGDVRPVVKALPRESFGGPRWLPDGRSILFKRTQAGGGGEIVAVEIESGEERIVYASAFLHGWDLAADGSTVVLATEDPAAEAEERARTEIVQTVSIATGDVRELARLDSTKPVQALRWAPDGQEVLIVKEQVDANQGGQVQRISVATGDVRPTSLDLTLSQLRALSFHPDGRRVMLPAGQRTAEVWTMQHFAPRSSGSR